MQVESVGAKCNPVRVSRMLRKGIVDSGGVFVVWQRFKITSLIPKQREVNVTKWNLIYELKIKKQEIQQNILKL